MTDSLLRALAFDDQIRVMAIDATDTVREAQRRHDTWANASAALGRTLVGTLFLASTIGDDDLLTVRIAGDGPLEQILATANGKHEVKGYVVKPHVELPLNDQGKIDVKGAVGIEGTITVTKNLGMEQPFSGQVPLVSGEIAEDFTYYLAQSEQIPSAMGLGVLVDTDESIKQAGGWMIQVLPGTDDKIIDALEKQIQTLPPVTKMLEAGMQTEDIVDAIAGRDNYRILAEEAVSFRCDCSKERFRDGLASIQTEDIEAMIQEDRGAEVICQFCGEKYQFTEDELKAMIA